MFETDDFKKQLSEAVAAGARGTGVTEYQVAIVDYLQNLATGNERTLMESEVRKAAAIRRGIPDALQSARQLAKEAAGYATDDKRTLLTVGDIETGPNFAKCGHSVNREVIMSEDCEKKAAELGFDLTKQFLTLAFAGIAFVVGLSFNTPGTVSTLMLWLVIGAFGGSVLLGLLFLMRGVNQLSIQKSYDIYAPSLRGLAIFQIILMLIGTLFLGTILKQHSSKATQAAHNMEIKLDSQKSVVYPIDPDNGTTVEIEDGKVKITSVK